MPGAFLEIERLVNRAVEIEHEMDAEAAVVVQDFEALAAGAGGIVMNDELIHLALKREEVPTAAADFFAFEPGKAGSAEAVAIGSGQGFVGGGGILPVGLIEGSEAAFDAVSIVTIGIEPQDNGRADVEELAGDNDFVTGAWGVRARRMILRSEGATDEEERADEEQYVRKMFGKWMLHRG